MKKYLFTIILIILSISTMCKAQVVFHNPESIVYDAVNNRYLISNVGDWNTGEGGGDIIARASDGTLSYFAQGDSEMIKGITILGGYLYGAANEGVIVYNLLTDEFVEIMPVAGAEFVNDICAGPGGFLYLTDADKIFKINSDGGASELFNNQVSQANGIIYDPVNDRLLVTEDDLDENTGGDISAIDMAGTTVTTLVTVPGQWLDGIAIDNDGNFYVGAWSTMKIYKYDPSFGNVEELEVDLLLGAADFCFNPIANELGIPLMDNQDIMFFSLGDPVGVEDARMVPTKFSLSQNYPNPFNPTTVITYTLPEQSLVSIKVYDILGNEITTLENGVKNAGTYNLSFDAAGLPTCIYFYTINAGNFVQTKKMLMLK